MNEARIPALPCQELSPTSFSCLGDAKFTWPEDLMAGLVVTKMNKRRQRMLALDGGSECLFFRTVRPSEEDAPNKQEAGEQRPAPFGGAGSQREKGGADCSEGRKARMWSF